MKVVSLENIKKYNELLNKKIVKSVNSVNSVKPDSNGNVDITIPEVDLSGLVKSVNNIQPDENGNVTLDVLTTPGNIIKWESDYFDIGPSKTLSFDLTGTVFENEERSNINFQLVAKVKNGNDVLKAGDILFTDYNNYVGSLSATEIGSYSYIRDKKLYIHFGNDERFVITSCDGKTDTHVSKSDVQCKIILTKVISGSNGEIGATTEVKGIVQLCDDIEQNTTNRTMAVTPHAVAAYISAGGRKANDIGIVGRQGFGVSFPDATEDELAAIGMSPMNGTYDKTSDNYGNFMSDLGGVFVFIPHFYVRYGEQTEADYDIYGANVLGVKSHDAYNSEAEANADGYFSPRAFYDGSESVNQQGFFMQKYEPNGKTLDGVVYPYGDGSARGMVNIIPPDMMTRARNLGSDYFVASYFMHQAMDTITLLQGQHSTGTANCAWWKSKGGANYPNNGWSTTNPQLYSHNGQKNGVMGVSNFSWEFCLGVTTSGTSATQGQTTVANNKIYLLKPTMKIKDLTNGFDGHTDAWGTTVNLLENYDEFDTTDHFVLTTSRTWYWGNGNNQMYISPVMNGELDTKARDSFMLIPNSEQSVSSSANTMMGACLSHNDPTTQNLALYVHGQNVSAGGKQNVFSHAFTSWRVGSHGSYSFRCGAYLHD